MQGQAGLPPLSACPAMSPSLRLFRSPRLRQALGALAAVAVFFLALWILHHELAGIRLSDVLARLDALSGPSVLAALGFVAASYLALCGYDALALRHLGRRLPWPLVLRTAFVATTVGHNLGMAVLSGGAIRYRLYSAAGLSAAEIATLIGLIGVTFAVGVALLLGLTLSFAASDAGQLLGLGAGLAHGLGALALGLVLAYILARRLRPLPLQWRGWRVALPAPATALGQMTVAAADIAFAAAVLYALLPAGVDIAYPRLLAVYVLAITAGVLSHVPGGLGVFETVLLLAYPSVPKDALLGAIVAYRALYYLLPLVVAVAVGLAGELSGRALPARGLRLASSLAGRISPQSLAAIAFAVGAILLFSGATPALTERMVLLEDLVPLAVVEASHMAASLAGLALMLLAQGLYRRVNAAYHLTAWLLVVAMLGSLAKGLDYEEALLAGLALLVLRLGRRGFYRHARLMQARFSPGWIALVVMAVAGSLWLGLFAYQHVDYAHELWWRFALDADAPRFLRATLVVVVAGTLYAAARLLQPHPPAAPLPGPAELARAQRIAQGLPGSDAALAQLGDKRLLFNDDDDGFVMYQIRGGSWIAMGDPVAAPDRCEALAWQFHELCDRFGGRTIFYQVDPENLPMYVDMGLALLKLGEEALIPLAGFSLDGRGRADLRQAHNRARRHGLSFEVIEPGAVDTWLPRLRAISEQWLAAKGTREKGFALGRFEDDYIRACPCALVYQGDTVVAFANLWTGDGHTEVSVDLMRYATEAPKGTMDYLFAELLLWGAARGYHHFNLGMAPLSGLEDHALAPLWHQLGTLVYRHGEHFYNFEGLRAYKAKFQPQWRPKYLAAPRGLALPTVLLDIATLIGGGFMGLWRR
jgi:phosphatidylglycerol lysyltransferase